MRTKGEGSVYQRQDGRWVATLYDSAGKRRELYADTAAQALARRDAAKREGVAVGGSLSVARWFETWLESARVTARTREGYESKIKRLNALVGNKRIDRLTPEDIERAYRTLRVDLSETSVLHCHRVLHTALGVAVKRGRIVRNPAALVDAPKPGKYRPTTFSADDARTLLRESAQRPNGARWWLALLLGLRNGEALGLWWDQIDLQRHTVTISHQLQRHTKQGLVRVPATKTRKDRVLPLPVALANILRNMPKTNQYVFTFDGQPISPERDRRDWVELLAVARLPYVRIYDCRHTTATLLMEYGVPARVVADILGHSTTRLTLDTYTHVGDHVIAGALDDLTAQLTAGLTADGANVTEAGSVRRSEGGSVSALKRGAKRVS